MTPCNRCVTVGHGRNNCRGGTTISFWQYGVISYMEYMVKMAGKMKYSELMFFFRWYHLEVISRKELEEAINLWQEGGALIN